MISSEFLGTQHRLLVMDLGIRGCKATKRSVSAARIRWWNLTKENAFKLSEKIISEASWKLVKDADAMREGMAQCIRRSAKEVLEISRGGGAGRKSGVWWWSEEVKEKVKEKQEAYVPLSICTLEEEKEVKEAMYKVCLLYTSPSPRD